MRTEQQATRGEVEAISAFLRQEDSCLAICPHHDVGAAPDLASREAQFRHHGDRLVPAQQRIGGFARSLLAGLGFPLENRFGLNPARAADGSPASLEVFRDGDELGILKGVETFNLHPHLPHLAVPEALQGKVEILARQPINLAAPPHPFVEAGNRYFNAFLRIPPGGDRAGNIFVCDATLWSSAFGGTESLKALWRNLGALH
jgi:hypothetical protein